MYGEVNWYMPSRKEVVRVSINGGQVYYDKIGLGFKKVSEEKRLAVIKAENCFNDTLARIFDNDPNLEPAFKAQA